jgi:hypothetical protein
MDEFRSDSIAENKAKDLRGRNESLKLQQSFAFVC